jgi:septum formation inhibitor-activating ATPase MinD
MQCGTNASPYQNENLYLLPAAQTREKDAVRPEQMKELAVQLAQEFDFVLVILPRALNTASATP